MLTISDSASRCSRRELLRIGSLGMAGLALPDLLAAEPSVLRDRSVIFLFQQGGPSQFETFDPKVDVPSAIRTIGGTVPTAIPGVHFGEKMSQLAKLNDRFTVVRSFATRNAGHNIEPIVGKFSADANIGVHYARVAGTTRADSGMPTNTVIYPQTVNPEAPRPQARGNLAATGPHSPNYAPFIAGSGGDLQSDMNLNLPRERFLHDRRAILDRLDNLNRRLDSSGSIGAVDELQQQAFEAILSGGVARAFDLSAEDPRVLEAYDTTRYGKKGQWDKVNRGKSGYYTAQAQSIGKLLLTARRLCEAGCGFVTIHAGYAGVWDMHADRNNLNIADGMEAVGRSFDHAVAAFIRDCESRGLSEKILLVCCGEMGRTPKINKNGGRDHWSRLAPLMLYGGGRNGGQVIGQSTRDGGEPAGSPLGPDNLVSTILHTLMNISQLRIQPNPPAEVVNLASAAAIPGTPNA